MAAMQKRVKAVSMASLRSRVPACSNEARNRVKRAIMEGKPTKALTYQPANMVFSPEVTDLSIPSAERIQANDSNVTSPTSHYEKPTGRVIVIGQYRQEVM